MEVARGVFTKKLAFRLGEGPGGMERSVHIALITGEKNCLVDTGTAGNFSDIVSFCAEAGVRLDQIDLVINTHCHADHIGADRLCKEANPRLAVCAHPLARPYIEDIREQYRLRPVPGFFDLVAGPVEVDRLLEDGERLDVGTELRVLHTPGHSAGSISLFLPERDVLVTGDAVPGSRDVPIYEDLSALRSSLERLRATGAGRTLSAFDGHCGGIAEAVRRGEGLIDAVDRAVADWLGGRSGRAPAADGADDRALGRFVLDRLGFPSAAPIPIVLTSIKAHLGA